MIEFKKKNFEKALEYLSKVEIIFFYFKYHLKILYLQVYYELNYTEQAISMIDSFKHFLKNNKYVPDSLGVNYKKFTDYYIRLLNVKTTYRKSEVKIFKEKIQKEERLFFKNWFLEKLNEL